jgi:CheY-like chemotaxis protein
VYPLQQVGVRVDMPGNGEQIAPRITGQQPDILFMDVRIPVMDGSGRQGLGASGVIRLKPMTALEMFERFGQAWVEQISLWGGRRP